MKPEYITYHSVNSPMDKRWIAYIKTDDVKGYWPIHFAASTEDMALLLAQGHYAACEEKREAAIKNRLEARERMKERKAKST